jgi:IMP and pyridine-specific 5'-nucleotidase
MITVLSSSAFSWVALILYLVAHQKVGLHGQSKLKLLVPTIGTFFTRLPLANAFRYQDRKRFISSRRFVPPSFNDIRLILNTAQLMGLTAAGPVDLATFDGDVTLYASKKIHNSPNIK